MSFKEHHKDGLVNQSHIVFNSGSDLYTTYSNTVRIPIVGPEIELEKEADGCEVLPDKPIRYCVTVRNKGNWAANVELYEKMPDGMAFVPNSLVLDGTPLLGAELDDGVKVGLVEPGDKRSVSFQLVLQAGKQNGAQDVVCNQVMARIAYRSSSGQLVEKSVYSNQVSLPVVEADKPLPFGKLSVEPGRAAPGERLKYSLLIGNEGHLTANITLQSFIPIGTSYVPNSLTIDGRWLSGWLPSRASVPLGPLAPGERIAVTWEVAVPGMSIVSPGQIIDNRALLHATYDNPRNGDRITMEFETNGTAVELCFPVIGARIKANPEETYPDGRIIFVLYLSNTGNCSAACGAEKLLSGPLQLVPGSMVVDSEQLPDGRYDFGVLEPAATRRIQFQGIVSPLVTTRSIRGHVVIQYSYQTNGSPRSGEVLTNSYVIAIMYDDE